MGESRRGFARTLRTIDGIGLSDREPTFRGAKLHLEESDVRLTDSLHLGKARAVFAEANRPRLPIVVHVSNNRPDAAATARAFLRNVLPAAADVPVQVAHLHGGGRYAEEALTVYAEAIEGRMPGTARLLFDVTDIAMSARASGAEAEAVMTRIVALMRRIGMERMLYGSDPAVFGRLAPREGWAEFRRAMPLTDAEIRTIAGSVAPYLR